MAPDSRNCWVFVVRELLPEWNAGRWAHVCRCSWIPKAVLKNRFRSSLLRLFCRDFFVVELNPMRLEKLFAAGRKSRVPLLTACDEPEKTS
jgi:hypothetical protein